jgi:thiol-disulfide isomerase/thioredoxin
MKKLVLLKVAIFIFFVAEAQNSTHSFNQKDSIHISGKIKGYQPSQEDHFITFSTYDLFGNQNNKSIQINNDGSFWIKLFQPFRGDVQMQYKDAYLAIYAIPGVPVNLTINTTTINDSAPDAVMYTGDNPNALTNQLIYNFYIARQNETFKTKPDMGNKKQGDSLYAVGMNARMEEELNFLKSFINKNGVKDRTFMDWQKQEIQYKAGSEILRYLFSGKLNTTITQEQILFYIKNIPINNSAALTNSTYYSFLTMLSGSQQIMVNINPNYEKVRQSGIQDLSIYLNEIDKFASSTTKELLYLEIYKNSSKTETDIIKDRFQKVIVNPFLKQQLNLKPEVISNKHASYFILEKLKAQKVSGHLNARLIDIFKKLEGKNVYIDFWGEWCDPCMAEMLNYPKLIAAVKDNPIYFLFFSTFTTDKNVLAIKKKYNIEGEFINLTKDEVSIMNNVFDFHSYPSHFLINQQGLVIGKGMSLKRAEDVKRLEEHLKNEFKW